MHRDVHRGVVYNRGKMGKITSLTIGENQSRGIDEVH